MHELKHNINVRRTASERQGAVEIVRKTENEGESCRIIVERQNLTFNQSNEIKTYRRPTLSGI